MSRRIATIDIGTNTVLLLVVEVDERGGLRPVLERATITRLGKGVDLTKRLAPDRVAATVACLTDYAVAMRDAGATLVDAVGTSAMRDATGGEPIREVLHREFGLHLRVIEGVEEAELAFLGATSGLELARERGVVVFDVGGGSTEFVRGAVGAEGLRIRWARSFDVGSVRLTERHLRGDPPTEASLAALDRDLDETLAPLEGADVPVVGVAGTVTTLAAIHLALPTYDASKVHGLVLSRATVSDLTRRLAEATLVERKEFVGLQEGRADVIVAGATIVLRALERLGAEELIVSDRGVRWGLAERAALATPPR